MFAGIDPTTAIALALGAGAALVFALLMSAGRGGGGWRRYRRRLQSIRERAKGVTAAPEAAGTTRSLARRESATPRIDRVVRRWLPRRELVAARLQRTGRPISIGQYLIGVSVGSGVMTIVIWVATAIWLAPIGLPASFLVGLVIVVAASHWAIGFLGKRRIAAFVEMFPEAIDLMVRAVRAGLPISEAIVHAGQEMDDPVGSELRMVEAGLKLGRDLEALLWEVAKRIDVPEFRFFVIAFAVQRETGGNLAETLSNLSDVLRRRRQMREKIHAVAAESRATTCILGGLPVVVMGAFWCTAPDYLSPLFSDVRGLFMCGVAVALLITGVTIMSKMANIKI
jgi:tight adherence protein B